MSLSKTKPFQFSLVQFSYVALYATDKATDNHAI